MSQTINERLTEINKEVAELVAESEHLMYLYRMGVTHVDGEIPENVILGPWEGSTTICRK